jgi:hypothetical protein
MTTSAFRIAGFIFGAILLPGGTFCWGLNDPSHELVNQEAANRSGLNAFLQQYLAMPEGIKTPIRGTTESRRVEQWLRLGGSREDDVSFWDVANRSTLFPASI